jgi:hypothetical protein
MSDHYGVPLKEVTVENVGVWIAGSSVNNPIEFSVAIVDLAIGHGLEIDTEVWNADRNIFVDGEPDLEMIEDLGFVTDVALAFLNDQVAEGFYFDFEDGLCLFTDDEEEN